MGKRIARHECNWCEGCKSRVQDMGARVQDMGIKLVKGARHGCKEVLKNRTKNVTDLNAVRNGTQYCYVRT